MAQIFKNNTTGTLASELAAGATACTLNAGHTFTDPGSDWYLATLVGVTGTTETSWEIVKVTNVATNTLTIERAQESTSDATWPAGTRIEARLTAGATESKANLGAAAYKAVGTGSGDVAAGNRGVTNGDSHAHGNITAAGAIGSTANLPLITTTGGALTVGAFGTGATNFCAGNDARLSDARTPTAHNQAETTITFTDVSTGNASTTAHGFAPKATAPASGLRSVLAIDNGETVRSDKALFDATNPAALGTASPGSAMTAARRDHVHALPSMQETLTAARTYYVRTDGNDANTGLANTSGGAFLTIGHAMDVARSINLSIYDITIAVGAGTFAEGLLPLPYVTGGGIIKVQGTAGSTTISSADGNCIESYGLCWWSFANLILTTSDGRAVEANDGSHIELIDVTFGAVSDQAIAARYGGWVTLVGDITITGDCKNFLYAFRNGAIYSPADSITLSGTRAFTTFAVAELASYIQCGTSFTGSATGKRYDVTGNGVIYTFGAGATYFPGDVAGTTATGGQYL